MRHRPRPARDRGAPRCSLSASALGASPCSGGHRGIRAARPRAARGPATARPDDGGQGPARRAHPGRLLDGDRHPSQERRTADRRRAAPHRSAPRARPGSARRSTLPTQSDKTLSAVRPAAGRSGASSRSASSTGDRRSPRRRRLRDPRRDPAGRRHRRGAAGRHHRRPRPAAEHEQRQAADVGLDRPTCPTRVEAWGALDRLIWQDTDSRPARRATSSTALRGWVAGGGRLVIVGGTAGPSSLSAFPDDDPALPPDRRRPTSPPRPRWRAARRAPGRRDRPAGPRPATADRGPRARRASATDGVAAERPYGSGAVTIVGFDPTADWLDAARSVAEGLWRRLIPTRTRGGPVIGDDSQIVQAASQLPSLALPPIGGLIALLGGYILLIGPINYLVLRRLDKREWAWVTMPVLIVAFAVGAYGFGSLLRGSDLIVNEVAIVRGAPGATEGLAQVYLGVFSPTRGVVPAPRPGRGAPVLADQRRLPRRRHGGQPRRPAGRSGAASATSASASGRCGRSAPRRAVDVPLVQADLAARGRPPQGHRDERVERDALRRRPSSSAARSPSSPTSRPARRRPSTSPLQAGPDRPAALGQDRGPALLRRPAPGRRGRGPPVRAPHDRRPADLRPELGLHRASCPSDGPVILAWADRGAAAGRDRGPDARGAPATSCGSCRPTSRSAARPRSAATCCARTVIVDRRRVLQQGPVQHQLRARARPSWRTGRSPFDGTHRRPTQLAIGLQLRRHQARRRPASPIEPLPTIPEPCAASSRRRGCIQRRASTACPRSSCST